jgi:hypothetical protein
LLFSACQGAGAREAKFNSRSVTAVNTIAYFTGTASAVTWALNGGGATGLTSGTASGSIGINPAVDNVFVFTISGAPLAYAPTYTITLQPTAGLNDLLLECDSTGATTFATSVTLTPSTFALMTYTYSVVVPAHLDSCFVVPFYDTRSTNITVDGGSTLNQYSPSYPTVGEQSARLPVLPSGTTTMTVSSSADGEYTITREYTSFYTLFTTVLMCIILRSLIDVIDTLTSSLCQ